MISVCGTMLSAEMEVVLSHRVCPWWLGYFLSSPLRRLILDPQTVVKPFVREGMTVLEPGPGMGFFTLEMARLVGASGRVVAVDIQPKMLAGLHKRVAKAGLSSRVEARQASAQSLEIADQQGHIDFTLAFAVVHECRRQAGSLPRQPRHRSQAQSCYW